MAANTNMFTDKETTNWFKACIALNVTKEGLTNFLDTELQKVHSAVGTSCGKCCIEKLIPCPTHKYCQKKKGNYCSFHNSQKPQQCQTCDNVKQNIVTQHRYGGPSWRNTHAEHWAHNYWEIGKCFLPPDGYSSVSSVQESDFNGVISIMLNCLHFQTCLSSTCLSPPPPDEQCPLEKIRQIGRDVRHTSDCKVTDADLQDYFKTLSTLLADPNCLQHDPSATLACMRLSDLQNDRMSIKELGELLKEAYQTLEHAKKAGERFSEEAERTLANAILDAIRLGEQRLKKMTQVGEQRIKSQTYHGQQLLKSKIKVGEQLLDRKTRTDKLPKDVQHLDDKAITLFYKALEHGKEKVNNVRLMVVGLFGVGKTSLVNNLIWEFRQTKQNKKTLSTEGIAIHRCKLMTDGDWCLDTELKGVKFGSRINDLLAERVTSTEDHETQTQTEPLQIFKEKIALHKGDEILQHGIKVAKKMLETTSDNSEKSNVITVSVWDFAGQTLYYSTHQFFLNERSIYLVVMDMTKSLKDVVSKSDGIGIWCGLVDSCTYLDIFKFWLNAIHMNSDYQSGERTIKPTVILVGTRKDKMKGSAEEKYQNMKLYFDNALCSFDKHSPIFNHIYKKRFLVNNWSPKDSAFAELRKEIISLAAKQDYWDEEYPVRWIHMERKLDKMRDEKRQIVKMKDVEKEDLENIQPLGKEALTLFLELQHKQGNIIFFNSGELKDFVVLAPQWIIEAFKCFIPHNQEIEATVLKDWEEYKTYAILKKNVLDEIMKNSPPYIHDYQTAVINYMEYLNVIAKPLTSEEGITGIPLDFHIVPCLLSRAPPPLQDFTSPPDKPQTPVLAFVFCGKFLPPSFFHRLLAVCIRAWPICQESGRYCLFNGLAIFTLNDTYTLRIWYMDYIIYARIVCCSENEKLDNFIWLFHEVRKQLKKSLKDFVHQSSPVFEEYIQCPNMKVSLHNKGLFLVKQFKYKNAIACTECKPHAVTRSNAMKHWFKERLVEYEKDDE